MVRLKHRYILLNILYPDARADDHRGAGEDLPYTVQFRQPTTDRMNSQILLKMIRQGASDLFGDYGSGMIAGSLQVKYFSPATSTAIIRVSRDHYRLVWAALTFTTRLPKPADQACVMQVVRVSGTIKKAEEEAIRRARLVIKQAQRGPLQSGMGTQAIQSVMAPDNDGELGSMDQDASLAGIVDGDDEDEDTEDEEEDDND